MQVSNKITVVTGAGNGIELTLQLLKKEAKVVGVDINLNGFFETPKMEGVHRPKISLQ